MRRRAAVALLALGALLLAAFPRERPAPPVRDRALPAISLEAGRALRVVALGTSLTARYDWPQEVGAELGRCLDRPVTVTKVAKPGANVSWGAGQVAEVAAAQPDIVLIEFAINDADMLDGLSLSESDRLHRQLVSDLRDASPSTGLTLMTMNPVTGLRSLVRPRLEDHYAAYGTLAGSLDLGLVDFHPRWLARAPSERGLHTDGLHPDPATASAVIVPALVSHLGRALGVTCGAAPPGQVTRDQV
ncbi:SGNH/GDSL hydrolase family protein [Rubellimicrobium roseum]|uniref:SGNH/GDSL hydrolase family protein n=1 Tax=Rubellimicrobium roseum TaxID=687525 RepID=A0A5C4NQV7_9RHOB|nr:SGNH/GDSL hydrolase family protein [Rubellimicrobium roseum]TNC74789.1 SGNH/GDSL hydrolase family protein [Rubellimicrobium roseum]